MILQRVLMPFRRFRHEAMLFEVTPRCNLRCLQCYNIWKNDEQPQEAELPTDRAKTLVRKAIHDSRCSNFTFTGGEPCLREDLEELVAIAAKKCRQVTLITNGTLLDDKRIKSLIEAGVSLFELPLNSADRAMHDRMSGDIESFDKVTHAAASIRLQGGEIAFVFVGTRHNIDGWREALELGIMLGARSFLFNRYNAGGECHGRPEELMPSVEQVKTGLAVADAYAKSHGVGIGASIAIPPCLINIENYPNVGFGFCAAGTKRAYYTLSPIGDVRPCNHTSTVLGNLFEQPLKQIVRSPKLSEFMAARPAFCSGCKLEDECQGACKAAGEACYGDLTALEPFVALNRDQAGPLRV